jgi:hypothetical protein
VNFAGLAGAAVGERRVAQGPHHSTKRMPVSKIASHMEQRPKPRSKSAIRIALVAVAMTLGVVAVLFSCIWVMLGFPTSMTPKRGKQYDEKIFVLQHGQFRIRAFEEDTSWLPGGIYAFEFKRTSDPDWTAISEDRHDGPIPIPDQVFQSGDQLLYLFFFSRFVCTPDGGRSWIVWGVTENLDKAHLDREYLHIMRGRIESGGAGHMWIHSFIEEQTLILKTKDWGRTWTPAGYKPGAYPPGPAEELAYPMDHGEAPVLWYKGIIILPDSFERIGAEGLTAGESRVFQAARAHFQEGLISAECYVYAGRRLLVTYKRGKHGDWKSLIVNLEAIGRQADEGMSDAALREAFVEPK